MKKINLNVKLDTNQYLMIAAVLFTVSLLIGLIRMVYAMPAGLLSPQVKPNEEKGQFLQPFSSGLPSDLETPTPTVNSPQVPTFTEATDLKQELERVDPQVLDSDFDPVDRLLPQL